MKERGRFILGMIMGIVCTVLVFTGVYAATAATDKKTPDNKVQDGVESVDGEDKNDSSEAGNLLTQNGSAAGFNAQELMDAKANYIMRLVDNYFLYDVTQEDYQTAIYRALMDACNDPYSCYYTKEEYASMQESTSGVYCGIGCLFLLYGLYRALGRPGMSVVLTVISLKIFYVFN